MSMSMFMTVLALAQAFIAVVTWASYTLGKTKTENARVAGIIGFMLCLFPPFALIYLVVLLVKPEIDVV